MLPAFSMDVLVAKMRGLDQACLFYGQDEGQIIEVMEPY